MEIKWTLILVSHPCGERAGSPARRPRAPRAPCSSGRGGPAVVPQLALWGGRWRQRLSPPRWLQSRVRTVWGLPSSGGTRSIARQAPLFYRWGDTELNSVPASPSAAPAGPCSRRPRPPRPATGRHAPPAATHSLVQCCHLSRGDSDSLFVSPLPPWPRARFQKELSKMQSGFSLVCEMLPGWPLLPWESVSSCRGGGRQGRGLPPRAHFPSVQSPGCLLPIPCVCHLPREALPASPLVSRVAGVSLRHGL